MPVNTGISPSLRRPQTFHLFTYLQGGRSLVALPQKLLLIGTTKGGTAIANTIYPINDPVETDALFGVGSELALMCRMAFTTAGFLGAGPFMFACGVAESAGVQHTQTFTFTGPATANGTATVRVAGRTFTIGITNGDSATTMALALSNALGAAKINLPVTAAPAAGVVTATHVGKGVNGNDVIYEVLTSPALPAGVTLVTAQGVAGTLVADETAALANAAGPDYDVIALGNHAAADVTLALAHLATAWSPSEKKWRWIIMGEPGTVGTATALASAANDRGVLVINCNTCPNLAGEMAAAAAVGMLSKSRPNGNWDGLRLPLYPPYDANDMTNSQIETALAAGLTPLKSITDPNTRVQTPGVVAIQKFVTSATTLNAQPFEALRDLAVSRTGAFIARQIDASFAARFGAQANPDGVLMTADTISQVRDMVANILYASQDARILTNVDNDIKQLVVEQDITAPGRVNVDVYYTVVLGLHQVAFVHRVAI